MTKVYGCMSCVTYVVLYCDIPYLNSPSITDTFPFVNIFFFVQQSSHNGDQFCLVADRVTPPDNVDIWKIVSQIQQQIS